MKMCVSGSAALTACHCPATFRAKVLHASYAHLDRGVHMTVVLLWDEQNKTNAAEPSAVVLVCRW